ncbi:DUF6371 domain-containing protein [Hymenobacter rubripertinctus]|uniref:DUF6371 domain-containing protein n=1 Tax=Hymenobacter rubripertinctus TaxID=2029981 RepID=UPI001C722162
MSTLTTHRYALAPYTGPKSRTTCPICDKPRCFTRYLDTESGELLPDEYGRCDRETNCGYSLTPYARPASGGLSYAAAVRRNERPTARPPANRPPAVVPRKQVLTIPADVFRASLTGYEQNSLATLLRQHFGWGIADELLTRFQVGTSAYWPGACVFWLIDERGRVRGGQVVLYDETGHTAKQQKPDGTSYRFTRWAHTALAATHRRRGTPLPAWLSDYQQHGQKSPCLFGLPQLTAAPAGQAVALVESAKTAILATPYFPQYVWLATGGLSYLTPARVSPLKGRRIVLFPDAGALAAWQVKATELRGLGFTVEVSDKLETLATADERAAGLDLADVLLTEWPGYPPSWDN